MAGHYWITLDAAERAALEEITRTGVRAAKTVIYARALLLLDRNADSVKRWTVASVGEARRCGVRRSKVGVIPTKINQQPVALIGFHRHLPAWRRE